MVVAVFFVIVIVFISFVPFFVSTFRQWLRIIYIFFNNIINGTRVWYLFAFKVCMGSFQRGVSCLFFRSYLEFFHIKFLFAIIKYIFCVFVCFFFEGREVIRALLNISFIRDLNFFLFLCESIAIIILQVLSFFVLFIYIIILSLA